MRQKIKNPGKFPIFQNMDKSRGVKEDGITLYNYAKNRMSTSFQSSQERFKFI